MKSKLLVLLASVAILCSCETIDVQWDIANRWDLEKYTMEGVVVNIDPVGEDKMALTFTRSELATAPIDTPGFYIYSLGCYASPSVTLDEFPIPHGNAGYRLTIDGNSVEVWNKWNAVTGTYTTPADQTFDIVSLSTKKLTLASADDEVYMFSIGN